MSMKLLANKAEMIEFSDAIAAIRICIGKSLNISFAIDFSLAASAGLRFFMAAP